MSKYTIKGRPLTDFIASDASLTLFRQNDGVIYSANAWSKFIQPISTYDSDGSPSTRNVILFRDMSCIQFTGDITRDQLFRPSPTGYICKTYDGITMDICNFLHPKYVDITSPLNESSVLLLNSFIPVGTTHFSAALVGGGGGGGGAGSGHNPSSGSDRYGGGGGGGASGTLVFIHRYPYNPSVNYYGRIGGGGSAGRSPYLWRYPSTGYQYPGEGGGTGGSTSIWYMSGATRIYIAGANGGPGGGGGGSAKDTTGDGLRGDGGAQINADSSPYAPSDYPITGRNNAGSGGGYTRNSGYAGSILDPISGDVMYSTGHGGDGGQNNTSGSAQGAWDKSGSPGFAGAMRLFFYIE